MKEFIGLLAVSMLLLGCVGNGATSATPTPAVIEATPTPVAVATATPLVLDATPTPAVNDATPTPKVETSALTTCLSASRSWKVDYAVKAVTNGESSQVQMTQYFKDGKIRTDVTSSGVEVRTFVDGTTVNSCFQAGGSWNCQASQVPATNVETDVKANADTYVADGTMSVAGTTANCFKGSNAQGDIRYCISSDCVPLFVSYSATQSGVTVQTETKATAYAATVADADFALPA